MRNKFLDKRIPTLLGLVVITLGIVITTFLVKGGTLFQIKAGPGQDPKDIKITNVSDTSFTVSYLTDDEVIGTLSFGQGGNLDSLVLDDRDQLSQSVNKYKIHSITVNSLDPNTSYNFEINSGDKKYDKNGSFFEVKTVQTILEDPSLQIPISGKAILPDGSSLQDGLVYVKIKGATELSTYTKKDGTYILPLNTLRTSDLNEYFLLNPQSIIELQVFGEGLSASASVNPTEISPVSLITLSNNYDFTSVQKTKELSSPSATFPTFGKLRVRNKTSPLSPTPAR